MKNREQRIKEAHARLFVLGSLFSVLSSVGYRLRQFFAALMARLTPAERELVARTLSRAELALFERMPRYDQRHCLDVCITLRAALLHDCGKVGDDGRPIPLMYYGAFVVILRLAPALYRWAARVGRGPL